MYIPIYSKFRKVCCASIIFLCLSLSIGQASDDKAKKLRSDILKYAEEVSKKEGADYKTAAIMLASRLSELNTLEGITKKILEGEFANLTKQLKAFTVTNSTLDSDIMTKYVEAYGKFRVQPRPKDFLEELAGSAKTINAESSVSQINDGANELNDLLDQVRASLLKLSEARALFVFAQQIEEVFKVLEAQKNTAAYSQNDTIKARDILRMELDKLADANMSSSISYHSTRLTDLLGKSNNEIAVDNNLAQLTALDAAIKSKSGTLVPRIFLVSATYGDLSPRAASSRRCVATAGVRPQCHRKRNCTLTSPAPAGICGFDPAATAPPAKKGVRVRYVCLTGDNEEWKKQEQLFHQRGQLSELASTAQQNVEAARALAEKLADAVDEQRARGVQSDEAVQHLDNLIEREQQARFRLASLTEAATEAQAQASNSIFKNVRSVVIRSNEQQIACSTAQTD